MPPVSGLTWLLLEVRTPPSLMLPCCHERLICLTSPPMPQLRKLLEHLLVAHSHPHSLKPDMWLTNHNSVLRRSSSFLFRTARRTSSCTWYLVNFLLPGLFSSFSLSKSRQKSSSQSHANQKLCRVLIISIHRTFRVLVLVFLQILLQVSRGESPSPPTHGCCSTRHSRMACQCRIVHHVLCLLSREFPSILLIPLSPFFLSIVIPITVLFIPRLLDIIVRVVPPIILTFSTTVAVIVVVAVVVVVVAVGVVVVLVILVLLVVVVVVVVVIEPLCSWHPLCGG